MERVSNLSDAPIRAYTRSIHFRLASLCNTHSDSLWRVAVRVSRQTQMPLSTEQNRKGTFPREPNRCSNDHHSRPTRG